MNKTVKKIKAEPLSLASAWKDRKKLLAEARKLWAQADKLYSKGDRLRVKGDKLWGKAVFAVHGSLNNIEWKSEFECHLSNGDVFK